MSAMRRPAILIAALAVLGSALTACGSQPREANSAVIIGNRVVSVDDVQRRLENALNNEPAATELAKSHKLDLVSRGIVSQLVRHELITEVAERENLSVSDREIDELLASNAPPEDPVQRSVQAAFDPKEYAKDRLLVQRLGAKYQDKVEISFDGATVRSPTDSKAQAIDLAKRIAAEPDKAADIVRATAGTDPQSPVRPVLGEVQSPLTAFMIAVENKALLSPLFAAQQDTVVAFEFLSGDQSGPAAWLVALIKKRDNDATLPEDQAGIVSQVSPQWQEEIGNRLLGPVVTELGVRVSPRYGVWDELAVNVAPSEGEKTGVLLPVDGQSQQ